MRSTILVNNIIQYTDRTYYIALIMYFLIVIVLVLVRSKEDKHVGSIHNLSGLWQSSFNVGIPMRASPRCIMGVNHTCGICYKKSVI